MKRLLVRDRDHRLVWMMGDERKERTVAVLPDKCTKCGTRGGCLVQQSGQVKCAECGSLLRQADR
jgi:ribosomal protein S27E